MKKLLFIILIMFGFANSVNSANYMSCEDAMNTGKPFVLYIHANSCYACKQFTPIFKKIMNSMPDYNVVDINLSYMQPHNVCSAAETNTIPAVYVVNSQKRTRSKISFSTYFNEKNFVSALVDLMNE